MVGDVRNVWGDMLWWSGVVRCQPLCLSWVGGLQATVSIDFVGLGSACWSFPIVQSFLLLLLLVLA